MIAMTAEEVRELAARLDEAALAGAPIPQVASQAGIDAATAYAVQEALIERRLARGERLVGLKMGLTSRAKMAQVGVDEVIWGRLTDGMRVPDGGVVDLAGYIHPRAEPEIAFLMARAPEPGEPPAAFAEAVRAVAPALELIDSRYADFRFQLADVIADNTSAAGFAIGSWQPVPPDLEDLAVTLEVNGEVAETGSTAAILGDPRLSLEEGLRLAGRAGVRVREGWVFLAGAATAAVPLTPGSRVRASVERLGSVTLGTAP